MQGGVGNENVLKLGVVMVVLLCGCIRNHGVVYFKKVNYVVM